MEKASSNSQSSLGVKASPWGCTETGKISRSFYEKKKKDIASIASLKGLMRVARQLPWMLGRGEQRQGRWQAGREGGASIQGTAPIPRCQAWSKRAFLTAAGWALPMDAAFQPWFSEGGICLWAPGSYRVVPGTSQFSVWFSKWAPQNIHPKWKYAMIKWSLRETAILLILADSRSTEVHGSFSMFYKETCLMVFNQAFLELN